LYQKRYADRKRAFACLIASNLQRLDRSLMRIIAIVSCLRWHAAASPTEGSLRGSASPRSLQQPPPNQTAPDAPIDTHYYAEAPSDGHVWAAKDHLWTNPIYEGVAHFYVPQCPDGLVDRTWGRALWWNCGAGCPGGALVTADCGCACVEPSCGCIPSPPWWAGSTDATTLIPGEKSTAGRNGAVGENPVALVSCGQHVAVTCAACDQGLGESQCGDQCEWRNDQCLSKVTVDCGQHEAESCHHCVVGAPIEDRESYCHGQCLWLQGQCAKKARISCGQHEADSCAECPQGDENEKGPPSAAWCNGNCVWMGGTCVEGSPSSGSSSGPLSPYPGPVHTYTAAPATEEEGSSFIGQHIPYSHQVGLMVFMCVVIISVLVCVGFVVYCLKTGIKPYKVHVIEIPRPDACRPQPPHLLPAHTGSRGETRPTVYSRYLDPHTGEPTRQSSKNSCTSTSSRRTSSKQSAPDACRPRLPHLLPAHRGSWGETKPTVYSKHLDPHTGEPTRQSSKNSCTSTSPRRTSSKQSAVSTSQVQRIPSKGSACSSRSASAPPRDSGRHHSNLTPDSGRHHSNLSSASAVRRPTSQGAKRSLSPSAQGANRSLSPSAQGPNRSLSPHSSNSRSSGRHDSRRPSTQHGNHLTVQSAHSNVEKEGSNPSRNGSKSSVYAGGSLRVTAQAGR